MRYSLSADSYVRFGFSVPPSQQKHYSVTPENFLDNVFVVVFDDPGAHAYFTKTLHNESITFGPFSEASALTMYPFLKPNLNSQQVIDGNPHFIFDIGIGDGTGKDFDGTTAAELHFTFLSPPQTATAAGNFYTDDLPGYVFQDTGNKDWLLTFSESIFGNAPANNSYCKIRIRKDAHHHLELEKAVEINIFDSNGNLRHMLNTSNEEEIIVDYPTHGFQMLCMINGVGSHIGSGFTAIFSIGDPKTDAKITVTEDDV